MTLSPTDRSTIRRAKERAATDRSALYEVLDRNLVCHLGVIVDGAPRVLPTGYAREGDTLYIHGSSGARSLRTGDQVCVTVTELNGIVYARSVFHFSVNYASAVIHGVPETLAGQRKLDALRVLTEHLAPGSWEHARRPNKKELAQTTVLALSLEEAAVKIRTGDPKDEDADLELPTWAGVLPIARSFTKPAPSADLHADFPVPEHVHSRML
ncbi:pyridoxamine 5'-phosphate oxidase family protein [Sciscionella sediminilitoris]|uniref:pyridoxamine 5'-phosphate oxidase family protein n=1 Tax=Sciscionella sediminilitoris TaxID=1445613 RepID=UPI0004DF7FB1|nr:pyridoxamine 5'-phosphate oxidase family protein [Sciscionella sp. SE31]